MVEVKTGANELQAQQLENYLDIAREHGFDALITISNEIPPAAGVHPTVVDRRKLRKVALHHLSWSEVVAEAVMQKEFRGVADPDQAWILGELIRYLEHPKSGALSFEDMGTSWVKVREAVTAGVLRPNDKDASEVAARFDALVRFACLKLGRKLGAEVLPQVTREHSANPASRISWLVDSLVTSGTLSAAIRVPNAVSPMDITADLRANRVSCSFSIDAPGAGKPSTRVNWLLRQLKEAPDLVRVEAFAARTRGGTAELLKDLRDSPAKLVADPTKELRSFRVTQSQTLGSKRLAGRGSFIDSVLNAVDTAYGDIGQVLKAWSATPPRLRSDSEVELEVGVRDDLPSAALSSQDEGTVR